MKYMVYLLLVCALMTSVPVYAMRVGQAEFDDIYNKDSNTEMHLMGAGLIRFQVFKINAVGFYLPKKIKKEQVLTNVPKRLEIVYLQSVKKENLNQDNLEGIKANVNPAEFETLKPRLEQFNSWFQDVNPGDRYAMTYVPKVGTQVDFNGVKQGVIEGEDFSFAFFSMYVGAKPTDVSIKDKLINRIKK